MTFKSFIVKCDVLFIAALYFQRSLNYLLLGFQVCLGSSKLPKHLKEYNDLFQKLNYNSNMEKKFKSVVTKSCYIEKIFKFYQILSMKKI